MTTTNGMALISPYDAPPLLPPSPWPRSRRSTTTPNQRVNTHFSPPPPFFFGISPYFFTTITCIFWLPTHFLKKTTTMRSSFRPPVSFFFPFVSVFLNLYSTMSQIVTSNYNAPPLLARKRETGWLLKSSYSLPDSRHIIWHPGWTGLEIASTSRALVYFFFVLFFFLLFLY